MAKRRVYRESVVQPLDQSIRIIPLTKGQVAVVDAREYERLMQRNWCAFWNPDVKGFYAARRDRGTTIYMHREIVGGNPEHTDHRNKNTLDNRRKNLRPCSASNNHANSKKYSNNASGYVGVDWDKARGKWHACICVAHRTRHLGRFTDKEAAARAYDAAALEQFGEFARLNFPHTKRS